MVLAVNRTEGKRLGVLDQHRAFYYLLGKRENQMYTPHEQIAIRDEIKVTLERLWRTGEVHRTKPIVAEERRNVVHYLRDVFPIVLRDVDLRLRQSWSEAGFEPEALSSPDQFPRIRFGTWVGGDRAGHPLVTAQVTRETFFELREAALETLITALDRVVEQLTLSRNDQVAPPSLVEGIERLPPDTSIGIERLLFREEPWRQFAFLIQKKLQPTLH